MTDIILLYIWLAGILPAAAIVTYLFYFGEKGKRVVVDVESAVLIICGGLIGNWGIVAFFLMFLGMWIVAKIGEWISPLGSITLYDSGGNQDKKERIEKLKRQRKEAKEKWKERDKEFQQKIESLKSGN